jgi:hypothetical protein
MVVMVVIIPPNRIKLLEASPVVMVAMTLVFKRTNQKSLPMMLRLTKILTGEKHRHHRHHRHHQ